MKKLLIALSLAFPVIAMAGDNLPFVGTKHFSFGGVPAFNTSYTLSIKQNNLMTLKEQNCYSEHCDKAVVLYKGAFKSLVKLSDGSYIQIGNRQARMLDKNKKLAFGCDMVNNADEQDANAEPCVAQYYEP